MELYGPLATLKGIEAVIEATRNFMNRFKSHKIRAKFGAGEQAMIVYDVDIPRIMEAFPCDGSLFVEKKEEIIS